MRTSSPEETRGVGKEIARLLRPGDIVALTGNLGSGKTQFVGGVCSGLGVQVHATSPTFTMINEYEAPFGKVVHIDLYRINAPSELRELGIEEYFNDRCICLIEWAETIAALLPPARFDVSIGYGASDFERVISISYPQRGNEST